MGISSHIRDTKRLAAAAGLEVLGVSHTKGQHIRMSLRNALGLTILYVMPATTSDRRSTAKRRSDFLRIAANRWQGGGAS